MKELIYPQYFEDYIIDFIKSRKGKAIIDMEHLIKCAEYVSDKLTVERDEFESKKDYSDPLFRDGYLFYIFPRSFVKAYLVLQELLQYDALKREVSEISLGDFGCGPGAGYLSAFYFFHKNINLFPSLKKIVVTAVDYKMDLISCGRALYEKMEEKENPQLKLKMKAIRADFEEMVEGEPLKERYDILFLINIWNELFYNSSDNDKKYFLLKRIAGRNLTKDGILIFIEPATKKASRDLMVLKEFMENEGFYPLAPCPPTKGPCPYLSYRGNKDWCHFKFPYKSPVMMSEVANYLHRDASKVLKWSYLVFSRTKRNAVDYHSSGREGLTGRIISDLIEEKGKVKFFLCTGGSVEKVEILKRNISCEEIKTKVNSGSIVNILQFERKNNIVRVPSRECLNVLWSRG